MLSVERHWPTLVAIPVMVGVGLWFWSNRSVELVTEEPPRLAQEANKVGLGNPAESGNENGEEVESDTPTAFAGPAAAPALKPLLPSNSGAEYRESLQFVEGTQGAPGKEFTQDSPEVKGALSQVSIELYGTNDCVHCEAAREFMKANQLRFVDHDVEADPMKLETARRLSGKDGVPVIVIDGKVLRGFSQGAFQAALTDAVRVRVQQ